MADDEEAVILACTSDMMSQVKFWLKCVQAIVICVALSCSMVETYNIRCIIGPHCFFKQFEPRLMFVCINPANDVGFQPD